jgi:Ran GTPase-activating protein (RanGAP) involved in mRNA processing and transport
MDVKRVEDRLTFLARPIYEELDAETLRRALAENPPPLASLSFMTVRLTDDAARVLADAPHLAGITKLFLAGSKISGEGLTVILSSPRFAALTTLDMNGVSLTREAARALATNPAMRTLHELQAGIREEAPEALAEFGAPDSQLTALERLHLTGRGLGAAGVRAILTSERLAALRSLSLMLPTDDWAALQDIQTASITSLSVHQNEGFSLGATAMAAFTRMPWMATLTALSIGPNHRIGPEGAKSLAASPYLARLENLSLYHNYIGDEGLTALASSPYLSGLRSLNLESNKIGDAGLIALAESPYLTRLEWLNLKSNQLTPEGIKALAASPNAAPLRTLNLSENWVGRPGARAILDSPHLRNIEHLRLSLAGLHEFEDIWYDQGFVIGSTPPDPEAQELRARFGDRVKL